MDNSVIDLIIRIKNGYMSRKEKIESPLSAFREAVLKKLKKFGYVKDYQVNQEDRSISIELLYNDGVPAMTDAKVMSTPGRRVYVSYRDLKPVMNNYGYSFLSTPKGIMTNIEAKKLKVGGELLFNLW